MAWHNPPLSRDRRGKRSTLLDIEEGDHVGTSCRVNMPPRCKKIGECRWHDSGTTQGLLWLCAAGCFSRAIYVPWSRNMVWAGAQENVPERLSAQQQYNFKALGAHRTPNMWKVLNPEHQHWCTTMTVGQSILGYPLHKIRIHA